MRQEEVAVKKMCMDIIKHKPDLVITEKGLSGTLSIPFHSSPSSSRVNLF